MLKIVEKINATFSAAFLVCSLGFVSCATTKGIEDTTVYETVTDAVTNSQSQSLTLGKKVKAELTETNAHVKDPYIEKVPVASEGSTKKVFLLLSGRQNVYYG